MNSKYDDVVLSKAKRIKLLALDVDGVLTNGQIVYDSHGNQLHFFHVRDGLGIKLLMQSGVEVAVISARSSKALEKRCCELGINFVFQGEKDKLLCLNKLINRLNLSMEHVCSVGDDLIDLPILKKSGLSVTVGDAPKIIFDYVDYVTTASGGFGAVREVCELILIAKGVWNKILEGYL